MNKKQKVALAAVILLLFNLFLVVIFGENGWVDYRRVRRERERMIGVNDEINRENLALYREIDRLKNDLEYLENVARQELGMIGKNEMIIKFKSSGNTEETESQ